MNEEKSILTALSDQVDCYRRLSRLTDLQHEHVQQSRTEELLELLGKRQEVLDQIAQLERAIEPARKSWSTYVGGLTTDDRRLAEILMGESRRLLQDITAADRDDAMVMQQRMLNLGKQINQARAAKQVNRAYAAAAYGSRNSRMDVQQ